MFSESKRVKMLSVGDVLVEKMLSLAVSINFGKDHMERKNAKC